MKGLRLSLIVIATAILTLGIGGMAYAFHSGGVAECEGCHSMHNPVSTSSLLVGATPSETCLTCHEHAGDTGPSSYHISTAAADIGTGTAPKQRTPGGDFGWLRKTYTWGTGTGDSEDGATHGHNVIAAANGYAVDPHNATAPGGSFPSSELACNSCHNEHGKYRRLSTGAIATSGAPIWASGSYGTPTVADNEPKSSGEAVGVYRLLNGQGTVKGGATFPGNPAAKVPSTYNRTEGSTQTRVAYGHATSGGHTAWGTWCATCHTDMHSANGYVHPTDEMLGPIATLYGQYVKSGDMSGSASSSYLSLVPFVEGIADYATLASHSRNNDSVLSGPATSDRVSCVSCHRTHASAWPHMLRFDYGYEFSVINGNYPAIDHPDYGTWGSRAAVRSRGRTMAEVQAGYYDRAPSKFATYQRVLCNKCHAKD